jgi:predicted Zn-dependent protease
MTAGTQDQTKFPSSALRRRTAVDFSVRLASFSLAALLSALICCGQSQIPEWQAQVRKYSEAREWNSALAVLDLEISRAPENPELKEWRARVLTWAGRLAEAEHEYRAILALDTRDPDNWAGLATVCLREGKIEDALRTIAGSLSSTKNRAEAKRTR